MPDVAKTLTDQVLRRVRDVHGLAHSRAFVRTLLSHSQRLLNSLLGIVTTSTTFTTYAHQQFYQLSGLLTGTDAITKVMAVKDGPRDLMHLTGAATLSDPFAFSCQRSSPAVATPLSATRRLLLNL